MEHDVATKAFYETLWPHSHAVLRMAIFLTHHRSEADDLAQETFLKAFRSLDQFQRGTDAKRWLFAILRNSWLDRLRAGRSIRGTASLDALPAEVAAPPPSESDADEWTDPEELLGRFADAEVISALRALPDEHRWLLLLVDVQGMDQKEAAKLLEIPVGTVKSRVHRAREALRQTLLPRARELGMMGKKRSASSSSEVNHD